MSGQSEMSSSLENMLTDFTLMFSNEEIKHITRFGSERIRFDVPTILVVEDQEFSRRLLIDMLGRQFICYPASTVQEAVALYAEHVPCITFLDIELPDVSGHDLAAFIKKYDPQSYVIMVTANHYEKDVMQAQKNNVQGFITKPFSKQKILQAIDNYKRQTNSNKRT